MTKFIKWGAIAGIIIPLLYLVQVAQVGTAIFSQIRSGGGVNPSAVTMPTSTTVVIVGVVITLLYIVYRLGFAAMATKYNVGLLKIMSYIFVLLAIIAGVMQIVQRQQTPTGATLHGFVALAIFGVAHILLGIGLLKLGASLRLAKAIGIIEIIGGGSFLLVLLAPLGVLALLVSWIMSIILLFKVSASSVPSMAPSTPVTPAVGL